jgi:SAM-dependent methyltransferase
MPVVPHPVTKTSMPDPAPSPYELLRLQKADAAVKSFCRILIDENFPALPRELWEGTTIEVWYEGLLDEVNFWWATIGSNREGYHSFALDMIERRKNFEYSDHLAQFDDHDIYVLDVGSGPFTTLGTRWEGRELHLSLADPLAPVFKTILQLFRIPWDIDSHATMGEHLTAKFAPETFHLVCARNSLDHSVDPLRCIREMLEVAKPGAMVVIRHIENEAEGGGYNGLHQWNFTEENGSAVIWNPQRKICLDQELPSDLRIRVNRELGIPRDGQNWSDNWIEILIEKPTPLN